MHDPVIGNGTVVDGTGAPRRRADVVVDGERIVDVAEPGTAGTARRTVDADGLVVTPGWVDIHTHDDVLEGHRWTVDVGTQARHAALRTYVMGDRGADLPAGGTRLLQEAQGYLATIKRGPATVVDGQLTGERPGRLQRGPRRAPADD